jgi:hypothetical protein
LFRRFENKPNLLFLEIGCFEGKATLWLLKNVLTNPSSKIEVIDTFGGNIEHNKKSRVIKNMLLTFKDNLSSYLSQDPQKNKVIIHKGESGIMLREMGSKSKFDFIYIDGSHIAKDVLEDAVLSWRLRKNNGVMIFDDYGWRTDWPPLLRPALAINSFLRVFQGQYKILQVDYQVVIQKKEKNNLTKNTLKNSKKEGKTLEIDEIENLQAKNEKLTKDLGKIQSAKAYLIWQMFCNLRKRIRSIF